CRTRPPAQPETTTGSFATRPPTTNPWRTKTIFPRTLASADAAEKYLRCPDRKDATDLGLEALREAGLREVAVPGHGRPVGFRRRRRITSHDDDWDRPRQRLGLQPARRLPAVHLRHGEVHHDDVERPAFRQ